MSNARASLRVPLCISRLSSFERAKLTHYMRLENNLLDRKGRRKDFDRFVMDLLSLDGDPSPAGLRLRLYDSARTDMYGMVRVMTSHGSSLIKEVNPVSRNISDARDWVLRIVYAAEDILIENGLNPMKAPDLVMLTSSWDTQQTASRKSMGLAEQLEAIRLGLSWQDVLVVESKGIPVSEWEVAKKLPAELLDSLYSRLKRG